jgi:adenylate cyclase
MAQKSGFRRRLAAIMFTDMVGYSTLANRNEREALALLDEHNALLRPLFANHAGVEINTTGDGFHVEFASALDAVRCAIDIQKALQERNGASDGTPIVIRIGIHLGDVETRDGDLYGDVVNIAARLEPLAEPGGICISEQVYISVRKVIECDFSRVDAALLKNIEGRVNVYRAVLPWMKGTATLAGRTGLVLRGQRFRKVVIWPVLGLLAVALAAEVVHLTKPAPPAGAARQTLAVLPFRRLGNATAGEEYLGVGLADALITKLSNVREIIVRPTNSVLKYDLPAQDAIAAAREQKVDTVLSGTIQRAGDKIRIAVQLVKTADGTPLWAQTFDERFSGIFEVQDAISEQVASSLVARLPKGEKYNLGRRYTDDVEAYDFYLRGRYQWTRFNEDGLNRALEYFNRAIAKDPNYALAYAGLSDVLNVRAALGFARPIEVWAQIRETADKAVALDDLLAEGHSSLAAERLLIAFDWPAAKREIERALELNPNLAMTYTLQANLLQTQGRIEESIVTLRRALAIEPLSTLANSNLASALYYAGRFDEAISVWNKTREIDPMANEFIVNVQALELQGKHQAAIDEAARTVTLIGRTPFVLSALGHSLASAGRREEALKIADELEAMWKQHYFPPTMLALLYAGLGDRDRAFAWLDAAYEQRDAQLIWLAIEPQFQPLHADPRWAKHIQRLKVVATR